MEYSLNEFDSFNKILFKPKVNSIVEKKNTIFLISDLNNNSRFVKIMNYEDNDFKKIKDFFEKTKSDIDLIEYAKITYSDKTYDFLLNKNLVIEDTSHIDNLIQEMKDLQELQDKVSVLQNKITNLKINIGLENSKHNTYVPSIENEIKITNFDKSYEIRTFPLVNTDVDLSKLAPLSSRIDFQSNPLTYENDNIKGFDKNNNFALLNNIYDETDKFIMYCEYLNFSFILDKNDKMMNTFMKFKSHFGFKKSLKLDLDTYDEKLLTTLFENKFFDDEKDFLNLLDTFKNTIKNDKEVILENKINRFIKLRYKITTSSNDCISAKELNESLIAYLNIEDTNSVSFRNKLGRILLNLGLQKKRKRDGIYYYGLVLKEIQPEKCEPIDNQIFNSSVNKLRKERDLEIKEIFPPKDENSESHHHSVE